MSGGAAHPERELPAITAEQMREVDRIMVDELGIELVQMMENAGRSLADLATAATAHRPARCWPDPAATEAEAWWRHGTCTTVEWR